MKNKKMILMGIICALSLGLAVTTYADINADLRNAAENGELRDVKDCLAQGAKVNSKNMDGYTALMLAIKYGRTDVVHHLVEKVKGTSECDGDAMYVAYEKGDFNMMQYLYDHGMTTLDNPVNKFKECIEKHFCYAGLSKGDTTYRFEIAKFIFEKYLSQKPVYNYTNCKYSTYKRKDYGEFSDENICELIDNKFIAKGDQLYTYAYFKGYTNVCKKLESINKNIKFDLKSADKEALRAKMEKAVRECDKSTIETLVNSGVNINDLLEYLNMSEIHRTNNYETLELLLNMDADINYMCGVGLKRTLLFWAIEGVFSNIVHFLLDHNANIYINGKIRYNANENTTYIYPYSNTALDFAKYCQKKCLRGNENEAKKIVKLLEEAEKKSPNPNAKPEKKSFIGKLFSKK